ncbi:DNA-methyltransferase Dcm [Shewanella psychrophila]|uniref:Cytosine-specific methyltransferase n=1 Tax=Shewanella psychrophila TaxID=225848 RepID=A0A1S6HIA2_9GAMM|nr:DNA cytosine methyltransferase [Shewanella psychrophila]AQS35242.1 DNA-methyltransferase Dcm [Shewanella psychrophila]
MNHIELFAGCGGLSLGLDKADFKLVMANELSPMAAETFAYNFLNENLEEIANNGGKPNQSYWLNSQFSDLKSRLRENPFNSPSFSSGEGFSDIPKDLNELQGKLVIGSIVELNKLLEKTPELVEKLQDAFGDGGLDLVSGGPPCQSFSMAGLRKKDCDKNSLPWEFAKFVSHVRPKIAVLENVTGILRAFKDDEGNSFHAWFEVAKVFATKGYIPLCLHINARLAGVAQNRPRFIMIAIREDIYDLLAINFKSDSTESKLFKLSESFFQAVKMDVESVKFGSIPYFDATKPADFALYKNSFLHHLVSREEVSVCEALDDLKQKKPSSPSKFVKNLNKTFSNSLKKREGEIPNNEQRNNSEIVKRRFRLYQVLQQIDNRSVTKAVFAILKGSDTQLDDNIWNEVKEYCYLKESGKLELFLNKESFITYLLSHPTKKQTQKALAPNSPAPAALSIPDDACHYDEDELRVLTVREMARIQSFPDNFVFRSKVTTGGQMRKFEVPQYTQVGNAVPPLLGLALGKVIKDLLNSKCDS